MNLKSTMGLAILSGGLAFAGSASAVDLILNGSFEEPNLGEWNGSFATYNFTAAYYAGPVIPESENPGLKYSWRHRNGGNDVPLTQRVDLAGGADAADIDMGVGKFAFSAWLSSYTANPEVALLSVEFLDALDTPVGGRVEITGASSQYVVVNADGTGPGGWTTKNWSKYLREGAIPVGARTAIVGITHDPAAGLSGNPDTYVDLVALDIFASAVAVPPSVELTRPAAGQGGVRPDVAVQIDVRDGTTQVNPASIQLKFDGAVVTPEIVKDGSLTRITFDPPGLLEASSVHTAQLVFADNGNPVNTKSADLSFTISNYRSLTLPAPIVLETFDGVAEGQLPEGWSVYNFSAIPDENVDFGDLNSRAYGDWNVIASDRFLGELLSYTAHTPTTDYRRVLTQNPANVVNGTLVDTYATGNILFGNSGYRSGAGQVLYTVTPDYDLSGRQNLYLIYKSLWEQNQDSMGTVEYSVDSGATWLPLLYMLDRNDVVRDSYGDIDPVATLSATRGDTARFIDADGVNRGTRYGDYIGVPEEGWSAIGSYISPRVDDDPVGSKRIEILPLPAAANQSKVRFRFGHAGADSWYFGIDDVGIYSVSSWPAPRLQVAATASTLYVGNRERLSVAADGVGPFSYQWSRNGSPILGATAPSLLLPSAQSGDSGSYTVEVSYPGGTVTGSGINITVVNPGSKLLGQWNFQGSLAADCGFDLEAASDEVASATAFGSTTDFGIAPIGGESAQVMSFNASGPFPGYRIRPGRQAATAASAAGRLNQYTLVMDLHYPGASSGWRSLLQTDPSNGSDGEFFINPASGIGISGQYNGFVTADEWHRIAIAVDLAGPGPSPSATIFLDGARVIRRALGEGVDARWSLPLGNATTGDAFALLFADESGDVSPGYVSSVQLYQGLLSDAAIAALGTASAAKLPGCIRAVITSGAVTISWTGGVGIETAASINGPWTEVVGATSPLVLPAATGPASFFRPKLP